MLEIISHIWLTDNISCRHKSIYKSVYKLVAVFSKHGQQPVSYKISQGIHSSDDRTKPYQKNCNSIIFRNHIYRQPSNMVVKPYYRHVVNLKCVVIVCVLVCICLLKIMVFVNRRHDVQVVVRGVWMRRLIRYVVQVLVSIEFC